MIDSKMLLTDLKKQLRLLSDDLRERAESDHDWGVRLRDEHERATLRGRTGLSWIDWRNGEVDQAAVAWIVASVFVRFCEDNDLFVGARADVPWIAAPGDGVDRAIEHETRYYGQDPLRTSRDWLQESFRFLSSLPAGRPLVDPDHSAVWHAPISASAADALVAFFRQQDAEGALRHDFRDADLGTRFLGDLYQDLSDYAKKTFALLQTPDFVEELILDQTLSPAIEEFGLEGLKLIDPTCGSGHFLLGAFDRLDEAWRLAAPALPARERAQRALDSIHGVDLNPFAVAISRFRLTVAALRASGERSLVGAPQYRFHLAIGDSLLGEATVQQQFDLGDGEHFEYRAEDLADYQGILTNGRYHVVVGNPPYITVKDKTLNQRYRELYPMCSGKYALSVPFMELFFRLARKPDETGGAGYVGKITANSFMKREFGKKVVEQFLTGADLQTRVDLTAVVDTSGAYIPGHGTPTVILVGRRRRPAERALQIVLGVRGEPFAPADPALGRVWVEIVDQLHSKQFDGAHVTVRRTERDFLSTHPWSLSGGVAPDLMHAIDHASAHRLADVAESIGIASFTLQDDAFVRPSPAWARVGASRIRPIVSGELLRDWSASDAPAAFFLYGRDLRAQDPGEHERESRSMWPFRTLLRRGILFGGRTKEQEGIHWTEFGRLTRSKLRNPYSIAYAEVATHNHFVLDRTGALFNRTAPVIKMPLGASEDEHLSLLGILNSSIACFWLKQVSHNKGDSTDANGARVTGDPAFDTFQFNSSKLVNYPLPAAGAAELARLLERVAVERESLLAATVSRPLSEEKIARARASWEQLGRQLVYLQEELDWQIYASYGLVDESLASFDGEILEMQSSERVMEVLLAKRIKEQGEVSSWFSRHARSPASGPPGSWPDAARSRWEARRSAAEASAAIRLLERPEYKRRWASPGWEFLLQRAARDETRSLLEDLALWFDDSGRPIARTAASIADLLRHDQHFNGVAQVVAHSGDFVAEAVVREVASQHAVPGLASLRLKPSGLEKFSAWQRVWAMQRGEDRGDSVDIPVPPSYKPADHINQSYWTHRGKLDVPKESFISFPGVRFADDASPIYGWAGWDHAQRGLAYARLANDLLDEGAEAEMVIPVVGALLEEQPWIEQWHGDLDPKLGTSPAAAIEQAVSYLLSRLEVGRDAVEAWRPPAPTPGRRKKSV